jgi:hypothetical protein
MLKLYKRVDGVLRYHEAWTEEENGIAVEHWGVVGERGESKNHPLPKKRFNEDKFIAGILTGAAEQGFEPIDDEDHAILLVEYAIKGMGKSADLDKRHGLEDRLNETLGWTGVGHCDGGSIGSSWTSKSPSASSSRIWPAQNSRISPASTTNAPKASRFAQDARRR